jgi:AraC-like DNA-binding protein
MAVRTPAVRPPTDVLPRLRRARDHIDMCFASALDLGQLASVAAMSRCHFARSFEAAYGETPIRYLTRRRIERAQDLLRLANLTVTEVCMAVGFASLGSFSSRFTQLVGEGPAAYRARWAARSGPWVPGCYLFMRGTLDPRGTTGG